MHVGVVVGCSRYEDARLADLKYAHEDAARFAGTLTSVAGVPPAALTVLRDGAPVPPTRSAVLRALAALATFPEPVDTLHFFFSGHGYHSTADGSDYLLLADSIPEAMEETSLRFEVVLRMLRGAGARHTLLYLDACRSTLLGGKSAAEPLAARVENLTPPGMVSFCSCEPGTVSYEADELGGGVFSAALSEALSEVGRCVTVQDLDDYLRTAVPALSRRTGMPVQHAHTRVEPLSVRDLEVVTPAVRNSWRTSVPVGSELRSPAPPAGLAAGDPLVCFDFGTSYSAVAVADVHGGTHVLPGPDGRAVVPSVVSFTPELDYRVGADAVRAEHHDPARTVRHVKRSLGTGRLVRVGDRSLAPELVASLVIRSLRTTAEQALGHPVRDCLAAYPANFGLRQVAVLRRAFELAGLRVARMVGEPNVAAMLLRTELPADREATALVVDLGGGTFDVAVAELADGVCEIRGVAGDNELGGLDYDEAIAGLVRERLVAGHRGLVLAEPVVAELRREAERAKRALGTREETHLVLGDVGTEDGLQDIGMTLTRDDVRHAVRHLDERVERVITAALRDSDTAPGEVDLVLLAGQGGKFFTVPEAVRRAGVRADPVERHRELAVVRGLVTCANVLTGKERDVLLLDLAHRGIGVRLRRASDGFAKAPGDGPHHTEVLVRRLTSVPARVTRTFPCRGAPDDDLGFAVVERAKTADEDVVVGEVRFPAPGGHVLLEVTVDVDAGGAIVLSAADLTNRVVRYYPLTDPDGDRAAWTVSPERVNRLVDGWTVHPPRALEPAGVTRDVPGAAEDLSSLDPDRELAAEPDGDGARLARARLLTAWGRAGEAMMRLYEVMRTFEGYADRDVEQLCRAFAEAVRAMRPEHRGPAVAEFAATLLRALRGRYGYLDRPAKERAAADCVARLKPLGDFPALAGLEAGL